MGQSKSIHKSTVPLYFITLRRSFKSLLESGTILEFYKSMEKKDLRKSHISDLNTQYLARCKTILHLLFSKVLSFLLILPIVACSPQTVQNITNNNAAPMEKGNGRGGGTGDGGGGQGVHCTQEAAVSQLRGKLIVRDIYEAMYNHRRTFRFELGKTKGTQVEEASIKALVEAIKSYFGPATENLDFGKETFWRDFTKNISYIPNGSTLYPSSDANSPLAVPQGCEIVQIAYWDESAGLIDNGTLYVDQNHWEQLDQFNKIALLAHEYFFKQARKDGYKNSDFVRYKVGQLFTKEGLDPLFKDWTPSLDPRVKDILPESRKGYKYCEGTTKEDPEAILHLYQYEGKNKEQHIVIPMLKSSHINLPLLQGFRMSFDPNENSDLALITDFFILGSEYNSSDSRDGFDFTEFDTQVAPTGEKMTSSRWQNMRFSQSHLLQISPLMGRSLTERLHTFLDYSYRIPPVVWKKIIPTVQGPFEISILNSELNREPLPKTIKSSQELISAINKKIEEVIRPKFGRTVSTMNKKSLEDLFYSEMISVLHHEIDTAIANGNPIHDFPLWRKALADNANEYGLSDLSLIQDEQITVKLPSMLYRIKINNYDPSKIAESVFKSREGRISSSYNFSPGVISVSRNNQKLNYILKCKDYPTTFLEATKVDRSSNLKKTMNTVSSIQYTNDPTLPPPKETLPSDIADDYLREKPINNLYLESFMDYLKSGRIKSYNDFLKMGREKCVEKSNEPGLYSPEKNCRDISDLYASLIDETSIAVTDCYGNGYTEQYELEEVEAPGPKSCANLNLKNLQERYVVIFRKKKIEYKDNGHDSEGRPIYKAVKDEAYYTPPEILFVLRIP